MTWDQREITGYIVDIETNERLEFQYNPGDIADDKSTDYACRLRISDLRLTIGMQPGGEGLNARIEHNRQSAITNR